MKHQQRTANKVKNIRVECLDCGEAIYIRRNPTIGNIVTCDSCDSQFEIVELEPIMIDWPYDYEYDDDENIYDEDDDI